MSRHTRILAAVHRWLPNESLIVNHPHTVPTLFYLLGTLMNLPPSSSIVPMSDCFEVLNDAKRLLIATFNYLSQGPKESVRASIRDGRFFKLCAWETPVGQDHLFSDLSKQLADIDTAGKLSSGIRSRCKSRCSKSQGVVPLTGTKKMFKSTWTNVQHK